MSENDVGGQADEERPRVRWAAEMHRWDLAAGTRRTVLRIIADDPGTVADALRAGADRIDVPRPYVAVCDERPSHAPHLRCVLTGPHDNHAAPWLEGGGFTHWRTTPVVGALNDDDPAASIERDRRAVLARESMTPEERRQEWADGDRRLIAAGRHICAGLRGLTITQPKRCGCPVVSPGGIAPTDGLSATQSAQEGPARGTDTPRAPGGAQEVMPERTPIPEPAESRNDLLRARQALMTEVTQLQAHLEAARKLARVVTDQRNRLREERDRLEQVCEALADSVDHTLVVEVWPERPGSDEADRDAR